MQQRNLRFRAWDKKDKFMFTVKTLNWALAVQEMQQIGDGSSYRGDYKNCVLMQYTGLKDKNSKPIFEGDILSVPYNNDSKEIFVVEWQEDRWWLESYLYFDWDYQNMIPWERSEIIGNVFENKELLKQ